jgi:hypothetical protein
VIRQVKLQVEFSQVTERRVFGHEEGVGQLESPEKLIHLG